MIVFSVPEVLMPRSGLGGSIWSGMSPAWDAPRSQLQGPLSPQDKCNVVS